LSFPKRKDEKKGEEGSRGGKGLVNRLREKRRKGKRWE